MPTVVRFAKVLSLLGVLASCGAVQAQGTDAAIPSSPVAASGQPPANTSTANQPPDNPSSASPSSGEQSFATVNGAVVTFRQYLHALEGQNVRLPGGQTTTAVKAVIDQIVSNQIILERAGRIGALPTDSDISSFFALQKMLYENQYPGKSYEESLAANGTTSSDLLYDMKVQLAETNLYARKLNITDQDLRTAYERFRNNIALPARVQMRLVTAAADTPEFKRAQALFAAGTPFATVARQVNTPQLRRVAGLIPEATPLASLALLYRAKVEKLPEGAVFGPVDFRLSANQPISKAWIKIERKIPAKALSYDIALPLIKRRLVTVLLADPENAIVRDEVVKARMTALFLPTDPAYSDVWNAVKKSMRERQVGGAQKVIDLSEKPAD